MAQTLGAKMPSEILKELTPDFQLDLACAAAIWDAEGGGRDDDTVYW